MGESRGQAAPVEPAETAVAVEVADLVRWLSGILKHIPPDVPNGARAAALTTSVHGLQFHLKNRVDFYGHKPNWVPLPSMDEYGRVLGDNTGGSLGLLHETEQVWDAYRQAVNNRKESRNQLADALRAGQHHQTTLDGKIDATRDELVSLVADIGDRGPRIQQAKKAPKDAIERFKLDVSITPGLRLSTFLEVMESLAFLPVEAGFQRYSMIASQVGKLGETAIAEVVIDGGDAVRKEYVIHRLDVMTRGSVYLQHEPVHKTFEYDAA